MLYSCSCGSKKPISRLYFCRHCLEIRCGFCVSHEVDSHYCPNCMENMPSAEARLKKNRCANCLDCPYCGHTLSTRATSLAAPSPEDPTKMVGRKYYYLACAFCRWTSRDVGLKDQSVASGGWPELENLHAARLASLQDHYRGIAQREKQEKEAKRFLGGRKLSYMQLSEKYGLASKSARKRSALPGVGLGPARLAADDQVELAPAEAIDLDLAADLPEDLLTSHLDLSTVTTLEQKFSLLEIQPERTSQLYPVHKHLMVKRSQRCRRCEHNLSKPEYNPTSIKFKIQLAAYYHVPEIVIHRVGNLAHGIVSQFVIKVVNPTNTATVLEFLTLEKYTEIKEEEAKMKEGARGEKKEVEESPGSAINPLRQPSIVESTDQSLNLDTADVILPKSRIYLPPRDDAAEFDEGGVDLAGHVDDREIVLWRKSNKVGILVGVSPRATSGKVVVGFAIQYQYTNTVFALDSKEVHKATMRIPVFLTIGAM